MAINIIRLREDGGLITCLSTDTKPDTVIGMLCIEEDTTKIFRKESEGPDGWVEKKNPSYQEVL